MKWAYIVCMLLLVDVAHEALGNMGTAFSAIAVVLIVLMIISDSTQSK